eukprot:1145281-Pelagomonas_calceolata.AAC.2
MQQEPGKAKQPFNYSIAQQQWQCSLQKRAGRQPPLTLFCVQALTSICMNTRFTGTWILHRASAAGGHQLTTVQ